MTLLGFGEDNLIFFDIEFSYVSIIGASISAFLGIVMAQSGFDKIFNWEGELDFITGKFAKTPLANFSTFGLIQVTIFEVLSGLLSIFGIFKGFLALGFCLIVLQYLSHFTLGLILDQISIYNRKFPALVFGANIWILVLSTLYIFKDNF